MTDRDQTIPGLPEVGPAAGLLERAVAQTLEVLHSRGYLTDRDAGKQALALELAAVIAHKRATGKASTIGMDARVLMEILDSFMPEDSETDTGLADAMAAWSQVVNGD